MTRDLVPLFAPGSVAVVGASNDPEKWGNRLALGALRGDARRAVYLVNRSGDEVLGRPSYRALADLPAAPELVVVAVPAAGFEQTVDAALEVGTRAIVAITSGLGELGPEGAAREDAVVERVRAAGAVMLGPNCLGVFDAGADLDLGWSELPPGPIGLLSQSGNLALELAQLAGDYGLGFSRFASLGNQADIGAAELVHALAGHDETQVIALYIEDFRDGRAFVDAAHAAVKGGTPVVLLAAGASEAGSRAALSHTGALASDSAAVDAACRAAGIVRVHTPRQLVDAAQALLAPSRMSGRRVAVVGDGGGHGAVAADIATVHGFELPPLSDAVQETLAELLPGTAAVANPVDFAGGGLDTFETFERVTEAVLACGEVDAMLLTGYFGGYSEISDELRLRETDVAAAMGAEAAATGRPLVVHSMYAGSPAMRALRAAGTPVYREIEAATAALSWLAPPAGPEPTGSPAVPEPAARVDASADDYLRARDLLEDAGFAFPPAVRVESLEEALAAAETVGYPVALKALGLVHKSDGGGVALELHTHGELRDAFSRMTTSVSAPAYSVERMAPVSEGVELIVGTRQDERFGPLVLVGLGGVLAELLSDVAVALAPARPTELRVLIEGLRGAALLRGTRGRPPVDIGAAAEAAAALSRIAARHPELGEIEVNPLLVLRDGALALDARIVPLSSR